MTTKRTWQWLVICGALGCLGASALAQGAGKSTVVLYYQSSATEGATKAIESRYAQLTTKYGAAATFTRVTDATAAKKDGVLILPAIKVTKADGNAEVLRPGQDEDASLSKLEGLLIAQAPAPAPAPAAAKTAPAPAPAPAPTPTPAAAPAPAPAPTPAPAPLPQTGPDWVAWLVLGFGLLGGGMVLNRLTRVRS